jgi:hypothetical protein
MENRVVSAKHRSLFRRRGSVVLAAAALIGFGDPAQAFFEMFFRGPARSAPSVRSYADPGADARRSAPRRERRTRTRAAASDSIVYCVRLCDGRHFPINFRGGGPDLCKALCPASPTETFSGTSIAEARSSGGKRYSDIPNAFVYRERLVDDCTCNGKSPLGLARQDIADDESLRRGDILATQQGFMSYRGDTRRHADFVPLNMKKLPRAMKKLADTGIRPEPVVVAPVETTGMASAGRYAEGGDRASR